MKKTNDNTQNGATCTSPRVAPGDDSTVVGYGRAIVASCSCGKSYNREQWQSLIFKGIQRVQGYNS